MHKKFIDRLNDGMKEASSSEINKVGFYDFNPDSFRTFFPQKLLFSLVYIVL